MMTPKQIEAAMLAIDIKCFLLESPQCDECKDMNVNDFVDYLQNFATEK